MPSASVQRPADVLLDVRDVHLWRGEHHLLRGISFSVRGAVVAVECPNARGKTSLLRSLPTCWPAESGHLLWQDSLPGRLYLQNLLYWGIAMHSSWI